MIVLLVLTFLVWLALAVDWAREARRVPLLVALLVVACTVSAAVVWWVPASDIPREWVTVLQESGGHDNILRTFGQRVHAGALYQAWIRWVIDGGDLRALVRANVLLVLVQGLLLCVYASSVLRSRAAGVVAAVLFLVTPPGVHMALSSGPSAFVGLLWWLAVLPVVAVKPGGGWAARRNVLSALTLAAVGACAGLVRVELLVPASLALLSVVLRAKVGDARLDDGVSRAWKTVSGAVVSGARARWFPYAVVAVLVVLHATRWFGSYRLGTLVWMLDPVGPELIPAVLYLVSMVPLVVVVLAVVGGVSLVRRPFVAGLATISLTALMRAYQSSSNSARFELFRYTLFVVPPIALHAVEGWRVVRRWSERRSDAVAARGLATTALLILLVTPPPAGMQAFLALDDRDTPVVDALPLTLSTVQQHEVREVLTAIDRWPTCVFVARVMQETGSGEGESSTGTWSWLAFGLRLEPQLLADDVGSSELARTHFPGRCVLYFRGQDCNRLDAPISCVEDVAGRVPLSSRLVIDGQYNEPRETGRVRGETALGVWPIDDVRVVEAPGG